MAPNRIYFIICLVLSTLCLTVGYAITGGWIGSAIAVMTGLAWLVARKYPVFWLPHVCLFASVGLAAAGLLAGSPPLSMIFGSAAALAAWDLLILEHALQGSSSGGQTRQYEKAHLRSLAQALVGGLMVAIVGRLLDIQIPFVIVMLLVLLAVFGLDRVWSYIKKHGKQISLNR